MRYVRVHVWDMSEISCLLKISVYCKGRTVFIRRTVTMLFNFGLRKFLEFHFKGFHGKVKLVFMN